RVSKSGETGDGRTGRASICVLRGPAPTIVGDSLRLAVSVTSLLPYGQGEGVGLVRRAGSSEGWDKRIADGGRNASSFDRRIL
ncbi:hypothetical protein Tco_1036208, partial [Tanacetum coccineum]